MKVLLSLKEGEVFVVIFLYIKNKKFIRGKNNESKQ